MKRFIGIVLGLLALVSCKENVCREYEDLVLESSLLGSDVHYSLVLPADYGRSSAEYPVLCLFHCIGGDCTTGIEYCDITHVLDSLVACKAIDPMIVVMPDIKMTYCADAFDGSAPYESMVVRELLPLVAQQYRTNGQHFTLGFSMGGFAAMAMALRNPSVFCGYAAMSPSVRTDEQYCAEMPQSGWEEQWGNKFGGIGLTGSGRLTDYYKGYCPLHLLEDLPMEQLLAQRHFLVVGNGERGTLAVSNPLLHQVMEQRGIPHYWYIGDGGHDFAFWRSQLPDALRFADSAFKGKEFEASGDCCHRVSRSKVGYTKPVMVDGARLYLPTFSYITTRQVPCIYVFGADASEESTIMKQYRAAYRSGAATPLAFCFIGANYEATFRAITTANSAATAMLRDTWRMRGAVVLEPAAEEVRAMMEQGKVFRKAMFAEPSDDVAACFPAWLQAINYKLHD